MSHPALVVINHICFQKCSAKLPHNKQHNPGPGNTGVVPYYQISFFPLDFEQCILESFNLFTSPGLKGWLWGGKCCSSGEVIDLWQVALNRPGRVEQDPVLGCCPHIQKCNGWNPRPAWSLWEFCHGLQQSQDSTQYISQPPAAQVCEVSLSAGCATPQSGSHLLSLVELLLFLSNEIQWEALPAFSWVGTSSWLMSMAPTAHREGGLRLVRCFASCRMLVPVGLVVFVFYF